MKDSLTIHQLESAHDHLLAIAIQAMEQINVSLGAFFGPLDISTGSKRNHSYSSIPYQDWRKRYKSVSLGRLGLS